MPVTPTLRQIVGGTTIVTYWLILLGIYTAATGAGLTCGARWPLCDGAVFGLFPANWPSFVEWFHRLVAMIAGILIIASAYGIVRWTADRRIHLMMIPVVVLLPVQVWLGAQTVFGYEPFVLVLHFSTAFVIFAGLLYCTTKLFPIADFSIGWMRNLSLLLLTTLPVFLAVSPVIVPVHSASYQVAYNGIGLAILAGMVLLLVWSREIASTIDDRLLSDGITVIIGVCASIVLLQLIVGRVVSVFGISEYRILSDYLVMPGTPIAFLLMVVCVLLMSRFRHGLNHDTNYSKS